MTGKNRTTMSERFEQQFRGRANALRRAPRPQAWQRLERRLDTRARQRRVGFYRLAGVAAGILLLVGLTWTLTQSAYHPATTDVAGLEPVPVDAHQQLTRVSVEAMSSYRARARTRYDSPIEEGHRDQQLVVVAPDGRKRVPTIAPAPTRARMGRVSRLRVRPQAEWSE